MIWFFKDRCKNRCKKDRHKKDRKMKRVFFIGLCCSFCSFFYAQENIQNNIQENQFFEALESSVEFRVQVSNLQGTVEYRREVSRFKTLRFGQILMEGSIIRLDEKSYLELTLWNNRRIQVYPNTEIQLQNLEDDNLRVELREGKLGLVPVDREEEVFFIVVETPLFTVESNHNENLPLIEYRNNKKQIQVLAGLIFTLIKNTDPKVKDEAEEEPGDIDQEDSEISNSQENQKKIFTSPVPIYGGSKWAFSHESKLENKLEIKENPKIAETSINKETSKSEIEEPQNQETTQKGSRTLLDQEVSLARKEIGFFRRGKNLSQYNPDFIVQIQEDDPFFRASRITLEKKIQNIRDWRNSQIFYWKLDFSTSYIEENFYFSLGWYPNLSYQAFSGQLRFLIHFPFDNPIRYKNWYNFSEWNFQGTKDFFEDLASKIDWISYTPESGILKFWVGKLEEQSYGYGLILRNYRNTLEEPSHRRTGALLDLKVRNTRVFIFLSDVTRAKILSIYIQSQPFLTKIEKDQGIDSLQLGFGIAMDLAPRSKSGNPQVFLSSLDFRYPFLKREPLTLAFFLEGMIPAYSFQDLEQAELLNQSTTGFRFLEKKFALAAGFKGKLFEIFEYEFQYRYLSDGSIPEYFDFFYESERIRKVLWLLASQSTYHGFLTQLKAQVQKIGMLQIEYYQKISEASIQNMRNRFRTELRASMHLDPWIAFHLIYERKNISSFIDFFTHFISSHSYLDSKISYSPIQNIEISLLYRYFFRRESQELSQQGFVQNWANRHFISLRGLFIF